MQEHEIDALLSEDPLDDDIEDSWDSWDDFGESSSWDSWMNYSDDSWSWDYPDPLHGGNI